MRKAFASTLAALALAAGALTLSSGTVSAQMRTVDSTFKAGTRPSVTVNPCLDDRGAARVSDAACGQWTWTRVRISMLELKAPNTCTYPPCRVPYPIEFRRPTCANKTYSCLVVPSRRPAAAAVTATASAAIKPNVCMSYSVRVDYLNVRTGETYADVKNGTILNHKGC